MPTNTPKITDEMLIAKLQSVSRVTQEKQAALAGVTDTPSVPWVAPTPQAGIARTVGDVGIKLAQGGVDVGQSVIGLGSLVTGGAVGKGMRAIGYDPERTNQILGEYLSGAQKAADAKVQQADGFVDTLKTSIQNPRSILGTVTESLPAMLAGMGATGAVARGIALKAAMATGEGRLAAAAATAAGRGAMAGEAAMNSTAGGAAARAAIEAAGFRLTAIGAASEGAQSAGQIADSAQGAGREYSDYVLPAVVAGAGTAAIAMGSNKIFGDAATDLATGSKTLTGSKLAKIGKGTFSEGVTEELPQSAQEQYFTNIAMGEADHMKGVGNAAASGLLAGAAMGAGMATLRSSHAQAKAEDAAKAQDTRQKVVAAAQAGDISMFTDPKSKDYDLSKGLEALLTRANAPDSTPETHADATKQAGIVLSQLEEQHAKAKSALDEVSTPMWEKMLADANTTLAATSPADTAAHAAAKTHRDDLVQYIADLNSPATVKEREAAQIAVSKLDRQLEASHSLMNALASKVEAVATPEEVSTLVTQAAEPAAAGRLIDLSMTQPESLTSEQAMTLAADTSNALTTAQRDHLRAFSDARLAENAISTQSKVSQEVLYGSDKNMGIAQYRSRITSAITAGNETTAVRQLGMLSTFAADHADKATTARQAMKDFGMGAQIVKTDAGWKAQPAGTMSTKELRKNGGLSLNSPRLVQDIAKEAAVLKSAQAEMKSATSLKFDVQSESSTQDTVPPGNINTPENEEDTARPVVPTEPVTAGSPAPKAKSKLEQGRERIAKQEAAVKAAEEAIAKRKADKEKALSSSSPAASPSSTPASLAVAGAPAATAPSSAPAAKANVQELNTKPVGVQNTQNIELKDAPAKAATVEQPAVVSEANPAPVAETVTPEAEAPKEKTSPKGVLSLFSAAKETTYKAKNLVAEYFKQDVNSDSGTVRPLASSADFLTQILDNAKLIKQFLPAGTVVSKEQGKVLDLFAELAQDWNARIAESLKAIKDTDYRYKNSGQFFLNADGTMDENVKTAISLSAFNAIIDMVAAGRLNDDRAINSMLGFAPDTYVSPEVQGVFATIGTVEGVVKNAWGQAVIDSLGLKTTDDAGKNIRPALEAAMGAHVLHLLMDIGVVVRKEMSKSEMDEYSSEKKRNSKSPEGLSTEQATARDNNVKVQFVRLDYKGKDLPELADRIFSTNTGTQTFMSKLFGVESFYREPALAPVTYRQKNAGDSRMEVPKKLRKIMERANKQAYFLNDTLWNNAIAKVSPEIAMQMAGEKTVDDTVHIANRPGIEAKNDGLWRELTRMQEFVEHTLANTADGIASAFHFEHDVWINQRVGIKTNMVNPQSSKLQRHLMYQKAWETTVNLKDTKQLNNFRLRVAEALGVKTDKKDEAAALAEYKAKISDPAIKAAVAVLQKSIAKQDLTENDQAVLAAGVAKGGENFHSLSGLLALAEYATAVANHDTQITVRLMGEVDGVTNGPMLSHLLFGAADTVTGLFGMLAKGGFYKQGSGDTQYNNWRGRSTNRDLYETSTTNMLKALRTAKVDSALLASVWTFTGNLDNADTGAIEKAGRDIIKTPLTALVFGSTIKSAVDSMADKFVESVYKAIEANAQGKAGSMSTSQIMDHLATMGVMLPADTNLIEHNFSKNQIGNIKAALTDTLGKATETMMKGDFGSFIERRDTFNRTSQLAFDLYNSVYEAARADYVQELVKAGTLDSAVPKNGGEPVALRDLNAKEEKVLRERLKALEPILQSAMSKDSNQLDAGLFMGKPSRSISDDPTYSNEAHFSKPFGNSKVMSNIVHGYAQNYVAPGVRMAPLSIHSFDSMISHYAAMKGSVLNIHDAHGAGLTNMAESARNLNQAVWDSSLEYSPSQEMSEALMRTVRGLAEMIDQGTLPPSAYDAMVATLQGFAEKIEQAQKPKKVSIGDLAMNAAGAATQLKVSPLTVLGMQAGLIQAMAYRADDMKLQAMEQMGHIDQYAFDGGSYAVTDTNRADAAAKRAALQSQLTEADLKAIATVESVVAEHLAEAAPAKPAKEAAPVTAPAGSPLHAIFGGKGTAPVSQVIAGLRDLAGTTGNDFYRKMLSVIEKTVLKDVTVRLVTSETDPKDLLKPMRKNAMGAYVSLPDGRHEINLRADTLDSQVILHELVHAALARTIANPSEAAKPLVAELEALLEKAREAATTNKVKAKYAEALKDVQEMVAWGMTNTDFANDVLKRVSMESTTTGNPLVSGMQKFIDTLVGLLFGRPNVGMSNGLSILVSNVSGLFNATAQNNASLPEINQSMAVNAARDLSTSDIYDALEQSNNGAQVSAEHSTHLKSLLNTLVNAVYGPFGSFKEAMMKQTAQDPIDVYTEALQTGVAPFASQSLAAGFAFTDQEAFVLEQVEATMRASLESKDGVMTIAYKELTKLYSEVRAKVKVEDFHQGDWSTANQVQKDEAQALYDFVFAITNDASGKSDYMSRFAALGMVHEGFRGLLNFHTSTAAVNPNMSFNERLNRIFNTIMSWVAGRMTDTFRGQRADKKLESLVSQMIQIEAKKRAKIEAPNATLQAISNTAEDMSSSVREAVEKFGKKPIFQNSGSDIIKMVGSLTSAVAGDRVDKMMEGYQKFRDATMTGQLGLAAALVNEVRGATESTKIYQYLLRSTKHLEGRRKDIATSISKSVTASFADGGEHIEARHTKALTAVVLRGDMQSLLGQYKMTDLHDLVTSRSNLLSEIAQHESQLAKSGKMSRFYVNSAKALGYFMATSKVTVAHQLMNAGNIARLYGTGQVMMNQVTEAQAITVEPIIDRLASLYALKYADQKDMKALREVFATEAARTDRGNGIEMIMKTHRALQAEAHDKLFDGSEALFMKGYVPEVYDPYMSVVVANESEGAALELKGYVAVPGFLGQDVADTVTEPRRLYALRDGGMKQWNSGIISTTDTRAKGGVVVKGTRAMKAPDIAAIKAGKRAGIQSMFTDTAFDPTTVKTAHMAPVMNANGDVANYRYMMSNRVKDNLLSRDNRMDRLLGSLAGNTFDKQASKVQNANAIKALHDQYVADFKENPRSYLQVGPTSSDPQLRELWAMMPRDTQLQARAMFGREGMMVRNDVLDINFGYRKLSLGTMFDKEHEQRNFAERMFVEIMSYAFAEKAQLRTRQVEDIWQAIVKETKANLVVKSWSTMSGNLRSNWSQLFLMGVSPLAIVKGHRVAFKAAWEYKQDSAKLSDLQHQQTINHLAPGQTAANLEYQVKRLQDSLARNPIRPLIDAGLMPTIVEDVSVDEDIYSYKSRFTEKVDGVIDGINPHILKATQLLTMHHSTAPYKVMSYATQISDFLARYTLYQHDITKANPLTHEEAVQRASEAFINYDVPTHRVMQYANDSGLIMFSKYYIRIQKVLARIYRDSPGRVLALMAAEHMIGNQPTVLDSGFTHHFGNPFNAGALSYLGSLDSVTTVGIVTSPFTTATYNGQ